MTPPSLSLWWSPRVGGEPGALVEGAQDVVQGVLLCLSTPRGSVANFPEYGSDHFALLDRPLAEVRSLLSLRAQEALLKWEPRALNPRVRIEGDPSGRVRLAVSFGVEGLASEFSMEVVS